MLELYFMVALVLLQGITLIFMAFLASRGTGLILELFEQLDGQIAEAITKLINEGSIDIEPPNPLQAIIANLIGQNLQQNSPRDPGGQFVEIKPKVE